MAISLNEIRKELTDIANYLEEWYGNAAEDKLRDYVKVLKAQDDLIEQNIYNLLSIVAGDIKGLEDHYDDFSDDMIDAIKDILRSLNQNLGSIDDTINDLNNVIDVTLNQCGSMIATEIADAAGEMVEGFNVIGQSITESINMSNEQFTEALESINYVMTEQLDIFAYALQDLNENMLLEMITLSNMVQATIDTTATELQAIVENETMITIDTVSSIAHSLNLEIMANYDLLSTYIQTSDDRIEQLLEAFNTKLDDLLNFDANSIMDGMNLASGNLAQQITSIINKISSGGLF
jgi:hypothetical protein